MHLPILFQDDHFVAILKPPGLLVHRSDIDSHETQFAVQLLRDQLGQYVYPIHRLDKPTSGVLLFGLNSEAASKIQDAFQQQHVAKTYVAIVRGITPKNITISHPVKVQKDKYLKTQPQGEGITIMKSLAHCELPIANKRYPASRYSLVSLNPITGKRHQLRYHMKHIHHPIIGDAKYGKSEHNNIFAAHLESNRLLLCATEMQFRHPFSNEAVTIKTLPDESFIQVLQKLGWVSCLTGKNNERT